MIYNITYKSGKIEQLQLDESAFDKFISENFDEIDMVVEDDDESLIEASPFDEDEEACKDMIESILAYGGFGKTADQVIDSYYGERYLTKYVEQFGRKKVAKWIDEMQNMMDGTTGMNDEGYTSIKWKDGHTGPRNKQVNESVQLNEGTGNFVLFDNSPNLAFNDEELETSDVYNEIQSSDRLPSYVDNSFNRFPAFMVDSDCNDEYACLVGRQGYYEGINIGVVRNDEFEEWADKNYEQLDGMYYEYGSDTAISPEQLKADFDENVEAEVQKGIEKLKQIKKMYGGRFINQAWRASNGETGYSEDTSMNEAEEHSNNSGVNFLKTLNEKEKFQFLSRMKSDCKYFLGNGGRADKYLWAGNPEEQIECMKFLFNSLPVDKKPEWISMEEIEDFENQMVEKGKEDHSRDEIDEQMLDEGVGSRGMIKAIEKAFDDGRYGRYGKWECGLGGYDTGYQVSYEHIPFFEIKKDNTVEFLSNNLMKRKTGYTPQDIIDILSEIGNYTMTSESDAEELDESANSSNEEMVSIYGSGIVLSAPKSLVMAFAHSGDNMADAKALLPYVKKELSQYSDEELKDFVKSYAIEDTDTKSREELELYTIWLCAWNYIDDEDEEISEGIEHQPDMFGGEDTVYVDGRQTTDFMSILEYMEEIAPFMDYYEDKYAGKETILVFGPNGKTLTKQMSNQIKEKMKARFGDAISFYMIKSQYAPEIKSFGVGFVETPDEEVDENVLMEAELSQDDLIKEYLVYTYMKVAGLNPSSNDYDNKIKPALVKLDKKYNNVFKMVDSVIANNQNEDMDSVIDMINAKLEKAGVSREFIATAMDTFNKEELGVSIKESKLNESSNSENPLNDTELEKKELAPEPSLKGWQELNLSGILAKIEKAESMLDGDTGNDEVDADAELKSEEPTEKPEKKEIKESFIFNRKYIAESHADNTIYSPKVIGKALNMQRDWYKSLGLGEDEQAPQVMFFIINDGETIEDTKLVDREDVYTYQPANNEYYLDRTRDTGFWETDYNLSPVAKMVEIWNS